MDWTSPLSDGRRVGDGHVNVRPKLLTLRGDDVLEVSSRPAFLQKHWDPSIPTQHGSSQTSSNTANGITRLHCWELWVHLLILISPEWPAWLPSPLTVHSSCQQQHHCALTLLPLFFRTNYVPISPFLSQFNLYIWIGHSSSASCTWLHI